MELEEIKALLDAKINPISDSVKELKQDNKKIVDLLENQATHHESIKRLWIEVEKCDLERKEIFDKMEGIKEKGSKKIWDVVKGILTLVAAGISGGVIGNIIK